MKNLIFLKNIYIKNTLICLSTFLIISCGKKVEKKPESNNNHFNLNSDMANVYSDTSFLKIDSLVKSPNIIEYRLIFSYRNKKNEIYKIENQDHSIEFKKKYLNKSLGYVCYEINDLPTGLVWNILYDIKNKSFYKTEEYDKQAIGDTLDRQSIDFKKRKAIVISASVKSKKYTIKLNEIWK
jgi:hypothetical protein